MQAQEKADILAAKWDKAHLFSPGMLNTLGWNNPFPFTGSADDYVKEVEDNWQKLKNAGFNDEDCVDLMLGGDRATALIRNL